MTPTAPIVLSPDQDAAADEIVRLSVEAIRSRIVGVLCLVGNAGTGKTTIMKEVAHRLALKGVRTEYMAPTGKAAARLRESLPADARVTTIHGRRYGQPVESGLCPDCEEWSPELSMSRPEVVARAKRLSKEEKREIIPAWTCERCTSTWEQAPEKGFETRLDFAENEDGMMCSPGEALICDEASMVSVSVATDVRDAMPAGSVLIYVGDDGQLPPVVRDDEPQGWGADFVSPTAKLTQVHRQAAGSPIIRGATMVRVGEDLKIFDLDDRDGRWMVQRDSVVDDAAEWLATRRLQGKDATLLSYTNVTRKAVNLRVREFTGAVAKSASTGRRLNAGDKVVCTANNHAVSIMNGEVFTVVESAWHPQLHKCLVLTLAERPGLKWFVKESTIGVTQREYSFSIRSERRAFQMAAEVWEESFENVMTLEDYLTQENIVDARRFLLLDFGECLTIHKSQGSQWDEVGVVWDRSMWGCYYRGREDWRRLLYTAITRAVSGFSLFLLKKGES